MMKVAVMSERAAGGVAWDSDWGTSTRQLTMERRALLDWPGAYVKEVADWALQETFKGGSRVPKDAANCAASVVAV